jgi:hypothetical protein
MSRPGESVLRTVGVREKTWIAEVETAEEGTSLAEQLRGLLRKNQHLVVLVSTPGSGKTYALVRALRNWAAHGSQRESLINLLTPALDVPRPEAVLQARRNSEARRQFLEEHGALTSGEVAALAGSRAANRSALANRWRKEGKVFAITLHDTLYYPGFQFDGNGRPLPVIERVLGALDTQELGEWEVALWFTKRTGWLDDRRPIDLLGEDPDSVVEAARRELHELVT